MILLAAIILIGAPIVIPLVIAIIGVIFGVVIGIVAAVAGIGMGTIAILISGIFTAGVGIVHMFTAVGERIASKLESDFCLPRSDCLDRWRFCG